MSRDLQAYFRRVGVSLDPATLVPDLATLSVLQEAHLRQISFENLDVVVGRRVSMAPADVWDKLVGRGRGGYCFEQNSLLGDVLTAAG